MARGTVSLLAYYGDYCTAEIVLEGKEGGREGESEGGTEGESEDSPKDNTGGQAKMTVFIINNTPQARENCPRRTSRLVFLGNPRSVAHPASGWRLGLYYQHD